MLPTHIVLYLRCGLIVFVSAVVVIIILYAVVVVVVNNAFHDDFHTHVSLLLTVRHKPFPQLPFVSRLSVYYICLLLDFFFLNSLNNKNAGDLYCLIIFILFFIIVCFDSVFHEKNQ